jgi:opacity protein-like surface antigen
MRRVSAALISGVSTIALTQVTSAADLPQKAPAYTPPPSIYSWTGFYIGGHVGYSWGSVDTDTARIGPPNPPFLATPLIFSFGRDLNPTGGLAGVQAGYNFQVARVVYGVEADLSWTGQRDSFNFASTRFDPTTAEDFSYQETLSAKLRYMGTVRGRIGYAFGEFLPYVTGGFAWGRMTVDLNSTLRQSPTPVTASFSGSDAHTLFGWTLGAGFEYAFAEHWSAKAEYLFVDLGEKTYFAGIPGSGSFGMQDHIVRIGVNFRP